MNTNRIYTSEGWKNVSSTNKVNDAVTRELKDSLFVWIVRGLFIALIVAVMVILSGCNPLVSPVVVIPQDSKPLVSRGYQDVSPTGVATTYDVDYTTHDVTILSLYSYTAGINGYTPDYHDATISHMSPFVILSDHPTATVTRERDNNPVVVIPVEDNDTPINDNPTDDNPSDDDTPVTDNPPADNDTPQDNNEDESDKGNPGNDKPVGNAGEKCDKGMCENEDGLSGENGNSDKENNGKNKDK